MKARGNHSLAPNTYEMGNVKKKGDGQLKTPPTIYGKRNLCG